MAVTMSAYASSDFNFPPDSKIHQIISKRIANDRQGVGIVVGLVGPAGRRIITHGNFGITNYRPVDADTVFEIGSVTKIFTALLLADAVQCNEMALTDPVAKYLPPDIRVPQRGGKQITLVDLATHTSGLPKMPDNFAPTDLDNPYADYSVAQLYQFLSNHQLTRDIGVQQEYSNLGFGLLGQALAWRAGTDYGTLVHDRILTPLGMENTAIWLSTQSRLRLATGHNMALEAVPSWDMPTLAGAGALYSTTSDLLTFLEMAIGVRKSLLAPALAATVATRRPIGISGREAGLGWMIANSGNDELIWHAGLTMGYSSFIGFLPNAKVGVVILSNTTFGVTDIGTHLFDPQITLASPPKQRTAIAIDPKLYERYVGRYRLKPDTILTVMRKGDRLFAHLGAERFEFFPEGERIFFSKVVDAQITFEIDGTGRAASLTLHHEEENTPALRIKE